MAPSSKAGRSATAVLVALCLVALLTGCAAWSAATAAPGARRGVDVPSNSGVTGSTRLGKAVLAPVGSGGYTFMRTHADGSPVTFDPCRPVHVVVRPDHEPAGVGPCCWRPWPT